MINPYLRKFSEPLKELAIKHNLDKLILFGSGTTMYFMFFESDIDLYISGSPENLNNFEYDCVKLVNNEYPLDILRSDYMDFDSDIYKEICEGETIYEKDFIR